MKVKNVQEHEDKTLVFEGTLTPTEAELVVSFGLNALMSLGLMSMIPSVKVEHVSPQDVH